MVPWSPGVALGRWLDYWVAQGSLQQAYANWLLMSIPWSALWRIRYYDIRPDGFSWVADRSLDDGVTWERNYLRIEARRIGPARSLEPLARPRVGEGR
jgi:hypothetical protein